MAYQPITVTDYNGEQQVIYYYYSDTDEMYYVTNDPANITNTLYNLSSAKDDIEDATEEQVQQYIETHPDATVDEIKDFRRSLYDIQLKSAFFFQPKLISRSLIEPEQVSLVGTVDIGAGKNVLLQTLRLSINTHKVIEVVFTSTGSSVLTAEEIAEQINYAAVVENGIKYANVASVEYVLDAKYIKISSVLDDRDEDTPSVVVYNSTVAETLGFVNRMAYSGIPYGFSDTDFFILMQETIPPNNSLVRTKQRQRSNAFVPLIKENKVIHYLSQFDRALVENNKRLQLMLDGYAYILDLVDAENTRLADVMNINEVDPSAFPYIAYLLGYNITDFPATEEGLRTLIRNLINVYHQKGSILSFEIFFRYLGLLTSIVERRPEPTYQDIEYTITQEDINEYYLRFLDENSVNGLLTTGIRYIGRNPEQKWGAGNAVADFFDEFLFLYTDIGGRKITVNDYNSMRLISGLEINATKDRAELTSPISGNYDFSQPETGRLRFRVDGEVEVDISFGDYVLWFEDNQSNVSAEEVKRIIENVTSEVVVNVTPTQRVQLISKTYGTKSKLEILTTNYALGWTTDNDKLILDAGVTGTFLSGDRVTNNSQIATVVSWNADTLTMITENPTGPFLLGAITNLDGTGAGNVNSVTNINLQDISVITIPENTIDVSSGTANISVNPSGEETYPETSYGGGVSTALQEDDTALFLVAYRANATSVETLTDVGQSPDINNSYLTLGIDGKGAVDIGFFGTDFKPEDLITIISDAVLTSGYYDNRYSIRVYANKDDKLVVESAYPASPGIVRIYKERTTGEPATAYELFGWEMPETITLSSVVGTFVTGETVTSFPGGYTAEVVSWDGTNLIIKDMTSSFSGETSLSTLSGNGSIDTVSDYNYYQFNWDDTPTVIKTDRQIIDDGEDFEDTIKLADIQYINNESYRLVIQDVKDLFYAPAPEELSDAQMKQLLIYLVDKTNLNFYDDAEQLLDTDLKTLLYRPEGYYEVFLGTTNNTYANGDIVVTNEGFTATVIDYDGTGNVLYLQNASDDLSTQTWIKPEESTVTDDILEAYNFETGDFSDQIKPTVDKFEDMGKSIFIKLAAEPFDPNLSLTEAVLEDIREFVEFLRPVHVALSIAFSPAEWEETVSEPRDWRYRVREKDPEEDFREPMVDGHVVEDKLLGYDSYTDIAPLNIYNTLNQKYGSDVVEGAYGRNYLPTERRPGLTEGKNYTYKTEERTPKYYSSTFSFYNNSPAADTIVDNDSEFINELFVDGQSITIEGTAFNDGQYTIDTVAAGTITLISSDSLTNEGTVVAPVYAAIRGVKPYWPQGRYNTLIEEPVQEFGFTKDIPVSMFIPCPKFDENQIAQGFEYTEDVTGSISGLTITHQLSQHGIYFDYVHRSASLILQLDSSFEVRLDNFREDDTTEYALGIHLINGVLPGSFTATGRTFNGVLHLTITNATTIDSGTVTYLYKYRSDLTMIKLSVISGTFNYGDSIQTNPSGYTADVMWLRPDVTDSTKGYLYVFNKSNDLGGGTESSLIGTSGTADIDFVVENKFGAIELTSVGGKFNIGDFITTSPNGYTAEIIGYDYPYLYYGSASENIEGEEKISNPTGTATIRQTLINRVSNLVRSAIDKVGLEAFTPVPFPFAFDGIESVFQISRGGSFSSPQFALSTINYEGGDPTVIGNWSDPFPLKLYGHGWTYPYYGTDKPSRVGDNMNCPIMQRGKNGRWETDGSKKLDGYEDVTILHENTSPKLNMITGKRVYGPNWTTYVDYKVPSGVSFSVGDVTPSVDSFGKPIPNVYGDLFYFIDGKGTPYPICGKQNTYYRLYLGAFGVPLETHYNETITLDSSTVDPSEYYTVGETVTSSPSGVTATVTAYNPVTYTLEVTDMNWTYPTVLFLNNISGTIANGNTVTTSPSGYTATVISKENNKVAIISPSASFAGEDSLSSSGGGTADIINTIFSFSSEDSISGASATADIKLNGNKRLVDSSENVVDVSRGGKIIKVNHNQIFKFQNIREGQALLVQKNYFPEYIFEVGDTSVFLEGEGIYKSTDDTIFGTVSKITSPTEMYVGESIYSSGSFGIGDTIVGKLNGLSTAITDINTIPSPPTDEGAYLIRNDRYMAENVKEAFDVYGTGDDRFISFDTSGGSSFMTLSLDGNGWAESNPGTMTGTFNNDVVVLEIKFKPDFLSNDGNGRAFFSGRIGGHQAYQFYKEETTNDIIAYGGNGVLAFKIPYANYSSAWNELDWNEMEIVFDGSGTTTNHAVTLNTTSLTLTNQYPFSGGDVDTFVLGRDRIMTVIRNEWGFENFGAGGPYDDVEGISGGKNLSAMTFGAYDWTPPNLGFTDAKLIFSPGGSWLTKLQCSGGSTDLIVNEIIEIKDGSSVTIATATVSDWYTLSAPTYFLLAKDFSASPLSGVTLVGQTSGATWTIDDIEGQLVRMRSDGGSVQNTKDWGQGQSRQTKRRIVTEAAVRLNVVRTTSSTLSFNDNSPAADTITDSASGLGGFHDGQYIRVDNSTSNDGVYLIDTVTASTITLDSGESLTNESGTADVYIEEQLTMGTILYVKDDGTGVNTRYWIKLGWSSSEQKNHLEVRGNTLGNNITIDWPTPGEWYKITIDHDSESWPGNPSRVFVNDIYKGLIYVGGKCGRYHLDTGVNATAPVTATFVDGLKVWEVDSELGFSGDFDYVHIYGGTSYVNALANPKALYEFSGNYTSDVGGSSKTLHAEGTGNEFTGIYTAAREAIYYIG